MGVPGKQTLENLEGSDMRSRFVLHSAVCDQIFLMRLADEPFVPVLLIKAVASL